MIKFEFGNTKITETDFENALKETSGRRGFDPGNYTVKISDAKYHVGKGTGTIQCASDPTWFNVSMTLESADGRSIRHMIQVPTKSIMFNGKSGKPTSFPFQNLQKFLAGIGVYLDFQNYAGVIQTYFGTEQAVAGLNGLELNIDIGFRGGYVKYVDKDRYQIVLTGDEPYSEDGKVLEFPDRDSAVAFAATNLGKSLATFPEVTKVHPAPAANVTESKASGSDW